MIEKERIVALATPHFAYPLERPIADDEVAAVVENMGTASHVVDLKVLGYALHLGVVTPEAARAKLGAPERTVELIANELRRLPPIDVSRVTETLRTAATGHSGPVTRTNSQEEGWAFTVLDGLHECSFERIADVLNVESDPAALGIRWTVQGLLSSHQTSEVVHMWAERGDALHVEAARFLVSCTVENEIAGMGQMVTIDALPRIPRAVISGRVLGDLLNRPLDPQRFADREKRRVDLIMRLAQDVPRWIELPADLRSFIGSANHSDDDLIAFILSLPLSPRALREARTHAHQLLRRAFQRVTSRSQLRANLLPYITGWTLQPLARAAVSIGIGLEYYCELVNNLAFDEFARDTDFELYLNDRRRAIVLAAIGAIVARESPNSTQIGDEARAVAEVLASFPDEGVEVLAAGIIEELERDYAIHLPPG